MTKKISKTFPITDVPDIAIDGVDRLYYNIIKRKDSFSEEQLNIIESIYNKVINSYEEERKLYEV